MAESSFDLLQLLNCFDSQQFDKESTVRNHEDAKELYWSSTQSCPALDIRGTLKYYENFDRHEENGNNNSSSGSTKHQSHAASSSNPSTASSSHPVPTITTDDDDIQPTKLGAKIMKPNSPASKKFLSPDVNKGTELLRKTSSQILYDARDIDALDVFKSKRSMESFSSVVLRTGHRPSIDRSHQLTKGEKILKSVLVKGAPQRPASPVKRKGASRPGRSVRFIVDGEGVDIASIRFIADQDEAPEVPLYATAYLNLNEKENEDEEPAEATSTKNYSLTFTQPGNAANFLERVRHEKLSLESCVVNGPEGVVNGTVCVANISYNKKVKLRYTLDNWLTHHDVICSYVYYASDNETDRFSFVIQLPTDFQPGEQLEFCVNYEAGKDSYWDNNREKNYRINCYSSKMLQDNFKFHVAETDKKPGAWLQYL